MVALDGAPGDDPIVHVQVEQPSALVIATIAMTDGRMVFAAARLQPERSDDREKPRHVGPMNQQVEIRLAAQRLRQPPVALPVTIAHAGASERLKQRTQYEEHPHYLRRCDRRLVLRRCGKLQDHRHHTVPSASFAKASRRSSTNQTSCTRGG